MWDLETLKRINSPNATLDIECKQCGECCKTVDSNFWYDHSVYTKEQLQLLRSKAKRNNEGCEMRDGKVCMVRRELGLVKVPIHCRQYCCDKEGGKNAGTINRTNGRR